tara:strand:- start:244 stop:435 length:192 start_codon:yes stop_codon:yes gene_type:complete
MIKSRDEIPVNLNLSFSDLEILISILENDAPRTINKNSRNDRFDLLFFLKHKYAQSQFGKVNI